MQTFSDSILKKIRRNYTLSDIIESSKFLESLNLPYGIQLLLNLPEEDELELLKQVIWFFENFSVKTLRLYPLVVLKGTELEKWVEDGRYKFFAWEETVTKVAKLYALACYFDVEILKTGIHTEKNLWNKVLDKNYFYPQIAENVKAYILLAFVEKIIKERGCDYRRKIILELPDREKSWIYAEGKKVFTFFVKKCRLKFIIKSNSERVKIKLDRGEIIWEGEWKVICYESGKAVRKRVLEGGVEGWKF